MDILGIAEENFLITYALSFSVGLIQGSILGRGIRRRFPSMKKHARFVSLILLAFFSINTVSNIIRFAVPTKSTLTSFVLPTTTEEGLDLALSVLGVNSGLGTVIAMFVTVSLVLFSRFADVPNFARYIIFTLGLIVFLVAMLARFTDFVPTVFQVMIYGFYQVGITLGIFFVTRRKEYDPPDIE